MQTFISSPVDARAAITSFLATGGLMSFPEDLKDKFAELANEPSWVDQTAKIAEFLYANHAAVSPAARDLAGSLAAFASANAWHGLDVDGRGNRIALAMRRENGEEAPEGSTFPAPEEDPAPSVQYAPAPEAAAA